MGRVWRRAPHHVGFELDCRSRLKVAAGLCVLGHQPCSKPGCGRRPIRSRVGPALDAALSFLFLATVQCLVGKDKTRKKWKRGKEKKDDSTNAQKNGLGSVIVCTDLPSFRLRTDLRHRDRRCAAEDQDQDRDHEDGQVSPRTG